MSATSRLTLLVALTTVLPSGLIRTSLGVVDPGHASRDGVAGPGLRRPTGPSGRCCPCRRARWPASGRRHRIRRRPGPSRRAVAGSRRGLPGVAMFHRAWPLVAATKRVCPSRLKAMSSTSPCGGVQAVQQAAPTGLGDVPELERALARGGQDAGVVREPPDERADVVRPVGLCLRTACAAVRRPGRRGFPWWGARCTRSGRVGRRCAGRPSGGSPIRRAARVPWPPAVARPPLCAGVPPRLPRTCAMTPKTSEATRKKAMPQVSQRRTPTVLACWRASSLSSSSLLTPCRAAARVPMSWRNRAWPRDIRSRCRPRSGRPTGVRPQTIRTPRAAGRWCVSGRSPARCGPSGSRHW